MPSTVRWFLVLCPLLLVACGPTLRQPETFTPRRVSEIHFDDRCQLQNYFDARGDAPLPVVDGLIAEGQGVAAGKLTFQLAPGRDRTVFLRLLAAHYERLPALDTRSPLLVTVQFLHHRSRRGAQQHLPIGASTELRFRGDTIKLPYHPCVGAFFFGSSYYQMRRELILADRVNAPVPPPDTLAGR